MGLEKFKKWFEQYPALATIGNTPCFKLRMFEDELPNVSIYVKCEFSNPGGSLKDRPVRHMLLSMLNDGRLTPGKTILDSSSGNAGIALAAIGTMLGFPVELCVPGNASVERKKRIRAHGAKIHETNPIEGYDAAPVMARKMFKANPEKYILPDQYGNPDNWRSHFETTAVEFINQVPEKITHFVSGIGTGGTMTGCGRRFKEHDKNIQNVLMEIDDATGIEGLKCIGSGNFVPEIFDASVVDRKMDITSAAAHAMCRKLARYGFFVGQSSGAYIDTAYRLAKEIKQGCIVTMFCDIGERYFSTGLWDQKE